jgi:starch synthase
VDATPAATVAKTATGFVFEAHTRDALVEAVQRAVAAFGQRPRWTSLMQAGMRQDFSWERSARDYVAVYERARAAAHRRRSLAPT